VRIHASRALVKLGPDAKAALPALIRATKDSDLEVRSNACEALKNLGIDAEAAIPVLAEALADEVAGVAYQAGQALARMGRPAVPPLIRALEGKHRGARERAVEALADIGPPAKQAVPALEKLLTADDGRLRFQAAGALAEIDPQTRAAIPALREALKSPDAMQRLLAAHHLAGTRAGAGYAVPYLIGALKEKDLSLPAYGTVTGALWRAGPRAEGAVPALTEKMKSLGPDPLAALAAGALLAIDPSHKEARGVVRRHLRVLGLMLTEPAEAGREFAADVLGRLGADAESMLPALEDVLDDPSPRVRKAARQAIQKIEGRTKDKRWRRDGKGSREPRKASCSCPAKMS